MKTLEKTGRNDSTFCWPKCFALWGLVLGALCSVAQGAQPNEQVWLISTRRAPKLCVSDTPAKDLNFYQLGADQQWNATDIDAFQQPSESQRPTIVYVHGNRVGANQALRSGWRVLRKIRKFAHEKPFRFVVWSWPSNRIAGRQRHDVQVKARYCDGQSYYLAQCLHQLPSQTRVSLIGYSFGGRIIGGALEMLAGGHIAGHRLPVESGDQNTKVQRSPFRVVLVAPAIDQGEFLPGHRNGHALSMVERVLVTENSCDTALRWYPRIWGFRGPQAMGYVGACCSGDSCEKIQQVDLSCSVGAFHSLARYTRSTTLRNNLPWYTFLASDE